MKVLHIIDSEGLYGAEMMLLNLAYEQKKMGLQPTILNMRRSNSYKASLESEAVRRFVDFLSIPIKTGPDFLGIFKIIRFANVNGYELFHSHGYKPNILLGFIPKKIRKLPLVTTLHGWTSAGKAGKLWLYERLDIKSLQHADAVVTVSKSTARHPALKWIEPYIIRNGISKIDFKGKDKLSDQAIVRFCEKGFTIGSIGRLSPEKGYLCLIEAFGILAEKDPRVRLLIIGEGRERRNLENKIMELRIEDRVFLPGYQPNAAQYIPLFFIFALSSLTEGLPITILEAMQANVPIVSTKVGGLKEVLTNRETGLLVKKENPVEFSRALQELFEDPALRATLAARARSHVIKNFSNHAMVQQYFDVYRNVLNIT